MIDMNNERELFEEAYISVGGKQRELELEDGEYTNSKSLIGWELWQIKLKAQAMPTWISVDDEWPPTDIMVLICWEDAPDVTPEQDYMIIDEDLNSVWANYHNDPPSHWMHFHSVPNVSGAEV